MSNSLFINLFARFLLVGCPVVAFRFAKHWSLGSGLYLLLCAAAGAVANVLFVASVVVAEIVWFPSTGALVSNLVRTAAYSAGFGLVLGAVGVWRRVASTSRLVLIGLVMVAAVDLVHIVVDPMFGLPKGETRPAMLIVFLILGSLIYAWNVASQAEIG